MARIKAPAHLALEHTEIRVEGGMPRITGRHQGDANGRRGRYPVGLLVDGDAKRLARHPAIGDIVLSRRAPAACRGREEILPVRPRYIRGQQGGGGRRDAPARWGEQIRIVDGGGGVSDDDRGVIAIADNPIDAKFQVLANLNQRGSVRAVSLARRGASKDTTACGNRRSQQAQERDDK